MTTYTEILNLIMDNDKTDYQKAADVHALIVKSTRPSALNIQPQKERKARGPNKAKHPRPIGDTHPLANGVTDDHGEAH